jgi:catechol 2,3-dioxygenase-like lactoylglutathione lyase family enzyme
MNQPDPLAGTSIFQVAFVVHDLTGALERYQTLLGPRSWRCYIFGADWHSSCEYRGGPTSFSVRLALSDGSPQLELIQPIEGPSIHEDWLRERGEGVHHLGVIVDSVPRTVERMATAGYEVVQTGSGFGADGDGVYAYFDTWRDIGVSIEVVEPPGRMPDPDFVWPER